MDIVYWAIGAFAFAALIAFFLTLDDLEKQKSRRRRR